MSKIDYSVLYATDWDSSQLTEEQKAKAREAIGAASVDVAGNEYTTAEKQKLGGIEAGAERNVQADWTMADSNEDSFIQHKPAMILLTAADNYISLSEPAGGGALLVGLNVSTGNYEVDGSSANV